MSIESEQGWGVMIRWKHHNSDDKKESYTRKVVIKGVLI